MMNGEQAAKNRDHKTSMKALFREGLNHLIIRINQCLFEIMNCEVDSPEQRVDVVCVVKQLSANIDFFSSLHLQREDQSDIFGQRNILAANQLVLRQGYRKYQELQSELRLKRRRNRKVVKANLELKKKIRGLKFRLNKLRSGIEFRVQSSGVRIQKLENLCKNLKSDLKKSNERKEREERKDEVKEPKTIPKLSRESQSEPKKPNIDKIKAVVDDVIDCQTFGILDENSTHIALKNQNSFLFGSQTKGFIVIEDGAQVFSGELPKNHQSLWDVIYILASTATSWPPPRSST